MNENPLPSWQVVLYSLYLEGGTTRRVHTEDVAKRAFELAPDALSWVKYPEYPDKEIVRMHLMRLRVGQHGGVFVAGRAGRTQVSRGKTRTDGWQLTEDGVMWLRENEKGIAESLGTRHEHQRTDRQHVLKSLHHLRTSSLFQEYQGNPSGFVPDLGSLAALLRCRVDSEEQVWAKRFVALRNQAQQANQEDVLDFLEKCEALAPRRLDKAMIRGDRKWQL